MRKTKIICTIGPACEHEDVLTRMIKAGMDVARLNFSHGSHEEHQGKIDLIKKVRQKLHMPIAIMLWLRWTVFVRPSLATVTG